MPDSASFGLCSSGVFGDRQEDGERRAFPDVTLYIDKSDMFFNDSVDESEAKLAVPLPMTFVSEEGFEILSAWSHSSIPVPCR